MKNIPLLIFDIVCLPISLIRLIFIYFFGARYNVPSLQFLDVMNHATNPYFNQGQKCITIDTENMDVRISINHSSRINAEIINETLKSPINNKKSNNAHDVAFTQLNEVNPLKDSRYNKYTDDVALTQQKEMNQSKITRDNSDTDFNNMDIDKLNKKLDEEIRRELDFLSYDPTAELTSEL